MIVITGASSGIGEACAKQFASEKKALLLIARREDRLAVLVNSLHKEFGVEVQSFKLDVRDRSAIEALAREQSSLLSRATVLINNAGLSKGMASIQESDPSDWEVTLDTNIKGLLYMTKALLPFFLQKKQGHIVNMGSVAGRWFYPKGNVYCATKSAVSALTQTMRIDLNGTGIRVTEISPGMVNTEFSFVRLGDREKAEKVYRGMTPLTATDIAEAVSWCVNRPRHVNVQELVIYPTQQASPTVVSRG